MSVEITSDATLVICRRRRTTTVAVRKFRATCGSTIEIGLNKEGLILHKLSDHLHCKVGCVPCKEKLAEVVKIIHKSA